MSEQLVSTLQALAAVLQTQRTLGSVLASIAETATASVPRCEAASIAISIEGRPSTAAITARVALELDMAQYESEEGPCLASFDENRAVRLDLVDGGDPFPHFTRAAADRGMTSVLSLPATWGSEVVATLNLYSRSGAFDESATSIGLVLASQVAIAVSRSPEYAAARGVVEQAQRDADDRADIDVATGLLMINEACTSEQATALLQRAATEDERSIVEIAQRIIRQHQVGR